MRKYKLTKITRGVSAVLCGATILSFTSCNKDNINSYAVITRGEDTYLCLVKEPMGKNDDYYYRAIPDGEIVGYVCSNGKSFDYECHPFSKEFLSELQVVGLSELMDNSYLSDEQLTKLSTSRELKENIFNYYVNRKYHFQESFEYGKSKKLIMINYNGNIKLGYDMTPDRLNDIKYFYSIVDMNTYVPLGNDNIKEIDASRYFEEYQQQGYITYNNGIDIINKYNEKQKQKILK